ncbi:putative ABC transport system permease protein [Thermoanaerobacter thermohydrosulfuricus]|uniref:ABC-type transport system, involved in lipoprotein release, permease component n=2 Tax=Thermoanaerobacter thermohydrosulfuricus TaxID=1516 RepID=M8DRS0_THETY|nr:MULTISPECIES: ABC transporter permease [Thermoanaerobacter]EMT39221.1 ABC-type transport system, involved in lipoprotein release, permease component [Thermoanaerobacter thermohydrosulfuricus WC1]SDG53893.1 putative ABC transport system permease protein [Thermoanaerobacter thermohydrosulfuricus]
MRYVEALKIAIRSILSNKMRSFLTMLGIIIGVTAVIALVSIGQGSTRSVTSQIQSMGSNLIMVNVMGRGGESSLTYDQAIVLKDSNFIAAISPVISTSVTAMYGNNSVDNTTVNGVNGDYQSIRDIQVAAGRFILPMDDEGRNRVAVLGSNLARELFGFTDPIGKTIKLNGQNFTVVGILSQKGSSIAGSDDDSIFIPLKTMFYFAKNRDIRQIYIEATSPDTVELAKNEINSKLLTIFKGDTNAFRIIDQSQILSTVNSVTATLSLLLGGIAGISLLVGGIGIMNIMLVSVTERTREIGIRKALGAKKKDILLQFIIESLTLSGLGGIVGIIVGYVLSMVLGSAMNINAKPSLSTVLISFSFSVIVGLFFGVYPANKAANLNPIEALRYE